MAAYSLFRLSVPKPHQHSYLPSVRRRRSYLACASRHQLCRWRSNKLTEVLHVVQVRAEGPKAPSPGQRPVGIIAANKAPCKGKSFVMASYLKAFALTGRLVCLHNYPRRCPGLGASALSGRVEFTSETRMS